MKTVLRINVDKRSIENIEQIANMIDAVPSRIKMANSRAGSMAVRDIKNNLSKRGRPGEVIDVKYEQYGDFGLRLKISPRPGRGGYNGGRKKSGQYSILIAARIFINSEEGKLGRRPFTLPRKFVTKRITYRGRGANNLPVNKSKTVSTSSRYIISHSSGRWNEGQKLVGPLKIPAIGPFHFSANSGMPRERISAYSRNTVKAYLNKYYDNITKRSEQ